MLKSDSLEQTVGLLVSQWLQLAINEAATSCAAQVAGHTWNTSYWTLQLAGGAVYVHIPLRQAGHGGLLVGETEVMSQAVYYTGAVETIFAPGQEFHWTGGPKPQAIGAHSSLQRSGDCWVIRECVCVCVSVADSLPVFSLPSLYYYIVEYQLQCRGNHHTKNPCHTTRLKRSVHE